MGTLREDVFWGKAEKYNQKLEILAKMAQPENGLIERFRRVILIGF